jgi:DNA-binding response OmpR family regulator
MVSARKILVVDDDPKTVSLVKLYLESDGHSRLRLRRRRACVCAEERPI